MGDSSNIQQFYRICYGDIVAGYSFFEFEDETYCLKHPSEEDLWLLSREDLVFKKEGISKKIETKSEKLKFLHESGNWTKEEEKEYHNLKARLKENERKAEKIFLKSQKIDTERDIRKLKEQIAKIKEERRELLGITLEAYIEKRKNEETLRRTIYKERELINLAFSKEECQEMDDERFIKLIGEYNFFMLRFAEDNLKKIAACSFFLNFFFLAKDSVFEFYGKRILDLTFYQQFLFSKGTAYKNALAQSEKSVPAELYEDLDKMVQWLEALAPDSSVANIGKLKGNYSNKSTATALVGATKAELEQVAAAQGATILNMGAEVRKMKKELGKEELSMDDVITMHKRLGI